MVCKSILIAIAFLMMTASDAKAEKLSEDLNSAVVYAYFRVGDDNSDAPGIGLDDFKAQMSDVANADNGYNAASLDSIIKAQNNNSPLPDKTIAISFEGSDSSFIRNAFPILKDYKIPFTLFISPGAIDAADKTGDASTLSWNNIRTIAKSDLATIGLTSYSYTHVDGKSLENITADINHARARYREELKTEPRYFSYPYGEYTADFITAIGKQGFVAAFGQQSGAISKSSSRYALPRFTMTDNFADIERFRLTALSLPFPATDIEPATTSIDINPPHPGFTVAKSIPESDLKKIKCFASGIDKVDVQKIGARRFEIRFSNGFEDSKGRLNCTIPAPPLDGTDDVRWRWLGFQFTVPDGI